MDVRLVRIFVAAPTDVRAELGVLRRVVADWNETSGQQAGAAIELVHWTTHSWPDSGKDDHQEVINRQALDACDIVLGIFWTRFGTPLRNGLTGTESEIRRSLRAHKPVMVYFSDRSAPPSTHDARHFRRINAFKKEFGTKNLYWTYKSVTQFEKLIRKHLSKVLATLIPARVRVAVGIVLKDNAVLMVKRRVPEGPLLWLFPGGFVKAHEHGAAAVVRHVKEETGIRSRIVADLGKRVHPVTGMFMEYYACDLVGGRVRNLDTEENVEVRWVKCADVASLVPAHIFPPVQKLIRKHR